MDATAELINFLREENRSLRERILYHEEEDRKLREVLLKRTGLLPPEPKVQAPEELKPIKKTTLPWSQVAAKVEADSRERYWKRQIEIREKPPEERKENPHYEADIKVLEESDVPTS